MVMHRAEAQSPAIPADSRARFVQQFPLKGFVGGSSGIRFVDPLSDEDLIALNDMLDWHCFTVDRNGRRFGKPAWTGKRNEPQEIPDRRVLLLHQNFDLADKHALEIGCFEGVHTVGLCQFARRVTAVDTRIGNVVKTLVRCAMYGVHPTVFTCDVERRPLPYESLLADVALHSGVLYHLADPVSHLLDLGNLVRTGLLLDTHYALVHEAVENYEAGGRTVRYKKFDEGGVSDPFSGMSDHAKWLCLKDIVSTLHTAGFGTVDVLETKVYRYGPRVILKVMR